MLLDLDKIYHEVPQKLYDVAAHYRAKRQATTTVDSKDLPSADTRNDVTILLSIVLPGEAPKNSGVNIDAFNKTKHQFLVTEDLSKYTDPSAGYQIEFGRFGMSVEFVTLLMQNTIAVAQMMRILANVMLKLDDIGVVL